ncbi:MAG TPA: LiaF domain-containing protein [Cyclobacteriaceae bacterium]|nr:LiaF domain-containing protein [Cyclobacteriaceae bacterium]
METENTKGRERFKSTRSGRSLAGLVLVIVGGVLLSRQLGVDIPLWLISWEMLLVTLGIYFGARRSFHPGGWIALILVGTAFLLMDFYPEVLIWHYIWPALIIVAGLWMILKPKKQKRDWDSWRSVPDSSDSFIETNSVFGGTKKKVLSKDFKGGEINTVFGGNDIDLSQADINGVATLEANVVFGGVKLIVPAHWQIKSEVDCAFGSMEDKRRDTTVAAENKTLVLKGGVVFGSIEIKSY